MHLLGIKITDRAMGLRVIWNFNYTEDNQPKNNLRNVMVIYMSRSLFPYPLGTGIFLTTKNATPTMVSERR